MIIGLVDLEFEHIKNPTSYCGYDAPELIEWDRTCTKSNIIVFTDRCYDKVNNFPKDKYTRIAWVLESPVIRPDAHEYILNEGYKYFDYVITSSRKILENIPNGIFFPAGGAWIWKVNWNIYEKSKNISIIASGKRYAEGHILRHEVIEKYNDKIDFICGKGYLPIEDKHIAFNDYRFSIVIENTKQDYYWTDKIIDCFACGTIPIFWGCPSIGNFFNDNGILKFNTLEELEFILNNIQENGEQIYNSLLPYVKENFEKAKQYCVVEDYLFNTFFRKLLDNKTLYNEIYLKDIEYNEPLKDRTYYIDKFISKNKFDKECSTILDAGCGKGFNSRRLIEKGYNNIFAIEISDICCKNYLKDINHECIDIVSFSKKDHILYDGVICTDVLEHIPLNEIDNTIIALKKLGKKIFIGIANHSDKKLGIELHSIQEELSWWENKLKKFFVDVKFIDVLNTIYYIFEVE